jgi:hypothetical protein
VLHQVYVDSSPEKGELKWIDKTTDEIGRHRIKKGKSLHLAEFIAVVRALDDIIGKLQEGDVLELYSNRQVVINQLNHNAGIKEKAILKMVDAIWTTAFRAKQEKRIDINFLWSSRKNNPAGKMLGV